MSAIYHHWMLSIKRGGKRKRSRFPMSHRSLMPCIAPPPFPGLAPQASARRPFFVNLFSRPHSPRILLAALLSHLFNDFDDFEDVDENEDGDEDHNDGSSSPCPPWRSSPAPPSPCYTELSAPLGSPGMGQMIHTGLIVRISVLSLISDLICTWSCLFLAESSMFLLTNCRDFCLRGVTACSASDSRRTCKNAIFKIFAYLSTFSGSVDFSKHFFRRASISRTGSGN